MSAASASTSHIPAWKRLGLKLKSEGDAPSPVAIAEPRANVAVEQPKRKRAANEFESTPIKKSKKALKSNDFAIGSTPTNLPEERQGRRKSVTFTPETKTEDGDSIKQLFNSWAAEQKEQDPSFLSKKDQVAFQTPTPSSIDEIVDATFNESERRVKRVKPTQPTEKAKTKKSKSSKLVKSRPIDPALSYLTQFHSDRTNWKFNKINQIAVLKNAFDTDLIPPEYSQSLYEYIAGLKGAARLHLRDRALVIRDKDTEDGEKGFTGKMTDRDRASKQGEYETAMQEYVATMTATIISSRTGYEEGVLLGLHPDTAMKERMMKRMRAERVLNLLASTPGDPSEYMPMTSNKEQAEESSKPLTFDEKPLKSVRKRKQRTAVYESDSSSSEESDTSDSGTSEDEDSDDGNSSSGSSTGTGSNSDSSTSSSGSSSDGSSDSEGSGIDDSSSSSSSNNDSGDSD